MNFYEYQHINQRAVEPTKCPFCSPKPKLELLTETALNYAVLDGYPVSKGHALVTPKSTLLIFSTYPSRSKTSAGRLPIKYRS